MDQNQSLHFKRLTYTLWISGFLNVFLLALFFYFLIKETPPRPYFQSKPAEAEEQEVPIAVSSTNREIIRKLRFLSIQELIAKLSDKQLVENGYSQRDLALTTLIAFHHFDLLRVLSGNLPSQQRKIALGNNSKGSPVEVTIYPNLSEKQYEDIINFARTESWPLTSKGIFMLLRKGGEQFDHSLVNAFFLTPEFISIETLFNRSEKKVAKEEILQLLMQGSWKFLHSFFEQQREMQDLSDARRQRFLLDYIEHHSNVAAQILLKTDGHFAATKLDDSHVIAILNLIKEKKENVERFAIILLTSPRGDAVWHAAATKLYQFAKEPIPEKELYKAALARFAPPSIPIIASKKTTIQKKAILQSVSPKVKQVNPPTVASTKKKESITTAKTTLSYVVQEGDSLWKISKRFKVDLELLKQTNRLQSDFLKPGLILKIPSHNINGK